ncbi:uncharacterized protein LOC116286598 [Actinia tenebrosa]|uniref:Uncharacterized protein LOC116286598 n=1 Tax=Actinia tenebrosa TaxID=6105 RepID=A0A6P8H8D7_ACTTE|nr:uncharacterized protein LOC116286598 [Actinia tenebrosa]
MTVLVLLLTGLIFGLDVQQTSCCPENCTCKIDDLAISSKKSFIAECKGLPYVPQVPSNVTLFILVNFSKEDFPRGSFINKTTSTWLEIRWSSLKVLNNQSFEGIDKQLGRLSITDSQLESIGDETFVRMRNLRRL